MAGKLEDLAGQVEELPPGPAGQGGIVAGRLGDRLRTLRMPARGGPGQPVDGLLLEAERLAHLTDGGPLAIGDHVAHHPGALRSVFLEDVLDHLLPMRGGEIDVDVRGHLHVLVQEALEEQVVRDRVDAGDAEQVGDDAVGRRAPTLARDAPRLREAHQVPVDQEELGKAGPVDDRQLALQPGGDLGRDRMVLLAYRFLAEPV